MTKDFFKCEDCNNPFTTEREECCDICDACFEALQRHIVKMGDRDYRMLYTRATVAYIDAASGYNNEKRRELQLRGFFACVMPEMPVSKADKLTRDILKSEK